MNRNPPHHRRLDRPGCPGYANTRDTRSWIPWALVVALALSTVIVPGSVGAAGDGSGPSLNDRLASLRPEDPEAYLALGEEFLERGGDASRRTARVLFCLALELSRKGESRGAWAHGACLALASMADSEDERRWLLGVARGLEPAPKSVRWDREQRPPGADADAYEVALAIGRYRSGDFRRARDALRKHRDAVDHLVRAGVDRADAQNLLAQVASEVESGVSCPRCRGARVVRRTEETRPVYDLCPVCGGNPSPIPLTPARFAQTLFAEAALVGARPESWSAQLRLGGARPLRDVDPASVASVYRIDPRACVWRAGVWTVP